MLILRFLCLSIGLLTASASWAQSDAPPFWNPRVLPIPAIAGQPVVVRLSGGGCTVWLPDTQTVTVQGNVVTLSHVVDWLCSVPPPGGDYDFALGVFPPGNYTLVYAPISFSGAAYSTQTTPFVVVAGPVGVPTISGYAVLILVLGLASLAGGQLALYPTKMHAQ